MGRGVELVSVEPSDLVTFPGLVGLPRREARRRGRVRGHVPRLVDPGQAGVGSEGPRPICASRARAPWRIPRLSSPRPRPSSTRPRSRGSGRRPTSSSRRSRWTSRAGDVTLARRLVVRLAFSGRVEGETGHGNVGRSNPLAADAPGTQVLARLATRSRGLHAVAFEEIPGLTSPVAPSALRLSRLGAPVAFHLEPHRRPFGPGSVLSFLADGTDSAYANEAVYELSIAPGGIQMRGVLPSRRGAPTTPLALLRHERSFETDATYLPALLEARDLWVWDLGLAGGGSASYSFTLDSPVLVPQTARLSVDLQGGSDTETDPDHHVLAFLNGSFVGETRFDGMVPATLTVDVPHLAPPRGREHAPSRERRRHRLHRLLRLPRPLLRRGPPRDRPPRRGPRGQGRSGRARQPRRRSRRPPPRRHRLRAPLPRPRRRRRPPRLERREGPPLPRRLARGLPRARGPPRSLRGTLRSPDEPGRLDRRRPRGADARGRDARAPTARARASPPWPSPSRPSSTSSATGRPGPTPSSAFLASAFHDWQAPAPRYVLLLGEASYDPKGRLAGTSRPDLIPSPLTKSTFLWTPADPLYAAVNGSDSLPDIAIGRINAASLTEAHVRRPEDPRLREPPARPSPERPPSSPTTPTPPETSRPTRTRSPHSSPPGPSRSSSSPSSGPPPPRPPSAAPSTPGSPS